MSELPSRVERAFRDHGSFERIEAGLYESVTTPFEGIVEATAAGDGEIAFGVTVRVPTLSAVTEDRVADVVEEGWYETFELRVQDPGGAIRGDRDLDPRVTREGDRVVVEVAFADVDERRGVDDAGAFVDFVEGTFVQGIIPGYDYTEPVAGILSEARATGGSEAAGAGAGGADGPNDATEGESDRSGASDR